MFSYAIVHLPFSIQPEPEKFNSSFNDGSALVQQIDMTAFVDDYDVKEDTPKFEAV